MNTSPDTSGQDRDVAVAGIIVQEPFAGPEIVRELRTVHSQSRAFWDSFSTPEFFAPLGEAWSPADNVRHLLKANKPVVRALGTPKALLLIRFAVWQSRRNNPTVANRTA